MPTGHYCKPGDDRLAGGGWMRERYALERGEERGLSPLGESVLRRMRVDLEREEETLP